MQKQELLLEIGVEEIPARMVRAAAEDLASGVLGSLTSNRLGFEKAGVKVWWTPRRLGVLVPGVDASQPDLEKEVLGPPVRIAIGPDGAPTRAGESFVKSCGLPLEKIGRKATAKGEVLCVVVFEKGRAAADVLAQALPGVIGALRFKKSMRWGGYDTSFVRPVRWMLAVFGGGTVKFGFGPLESSNVTFGLRNHPEPIAVRSFAEYGEALAAQSIICDPEVRKLYIRSGIDRIAATMGGHVDPDEGLLDEVTNLVECPVPFLGTFDKEFESLPKELLEVTQKHHQRYFPIIGPDQRITNHFAGVSNTRVPDQWIVTAGNERVLRARLKDAAFFYEEDLKTPLPSFLERLRTVVFQAKLGTYHDKSERVKTLVTHIAAAAFPRNRALGLNLQRAAELCKADLVSGMVGEFPELQGIMGCYYARNAGQSEEVAAAILEHYHPAGASSAIPATLAGRVLAVADKLDTIAGCFHAGLKPTGSADPYALRRAALGIVRILIDGADGMVMRLDLDAAIRIAAGSYAPEKDEASLVPLIREINAFFKSRLRAHLCERERPDVVDAFLGARATVTDIHDLNLRFLAFSEFKERPYFESFATAFKRAQNISKDLPAESRADPALFTEPEEMALFDKWKDLKSRVEQRIKLGSYLAAMEIMGEELLSPMHGFFEKVFVDVDDRSVRHNRKSLLKSIVSLFAEFADFSQMEFRKVG
jgi:glycyl-tRNA synthetase beta chain